MDFYTWRERRKQGLPGFESPRTNAAGSQSQTTTENRTDTSSTGNTSSRTDASEWAKSAASIINEIGQYYGSYKQNDSIIDKDIIDRASHLLSSASDVRNQFLRDSEQRKSINEMVDALSQAYNFAKRMQNEYSKYSSEIQYKYRDNVDFYNKYGKYLESDDFEKYSAKGAAIKNPVLDDISVNDVDYGHPLSLPEEDEIGNIVTYSRKYSDIIAAQSMSGRNKVAGSPTYDYMTDDEVGIYNYLLARGGKDAANSFLDSIQESLNARMGKNIAEGMAEVDDPVLSFMNYANSAISGGMSQWINGTRQFFINEREPTSVNQFVDSYAMEDLGNVGRTLYDSGVNIGNMLPSIMISMLTKQSIAGDIAVGVSAAGNAYAEKLNEGYTKGEARIYSTLVGAFEAGLQYAIGGISKLSGKLNLGGKVASKAAKLAEKIAPKTTEQLKQIVSRAAMIDNSFLRVARKYGKSVGSEIIEEELQNYIEPLIPTLLFSEEYDAPTIDELIDTLVVTALSTSVLKIGEIAAEEASTSNYNNNMYKDSAKEIINEAIEINPDNIYAQNLKKRMDSGKSVSGNQLATLIQQNEEAIIKNDRVIIENAAKNRLIELGENSDDVDVVAKAITKSVFGEKLKTQERYAVEASLYGSRVLNELNPANIRSGEYTTGWAENLDTNRINIEEYSEALNRANADVSSSSDVNSGFVFPESVTIPEDIYNGMVNTAVTTKAQNATPDSASHTDTANRIDSASPYNEQDSRTADTIGRDTVNTESSEPPEVMTDSVPDTEVVPKTSSKQVTSAPQAAVLETGSVDNMSDSTEQPVTPAKETKSLETLSKKYGKQAGAMVHTYLDGQDVVKYDRAYSAAYDMGKSGVSRDYAMRSDSVSYLNESQRQLAYEAGQAAANNIADERQALIGQKSNVKTGMRDKTAWRRGVVRGEGVSLDELKSKFNDTQNQAYKVLSAISEATGIDIALYKSETDASGSFTGVQGHYKRSDAGTIYLDINAGLSNVKDVGDLSKYTILRTFSQEFTHYIENWSPVRYNELRSAVLSHLTESGEDVGDIIKRQQDIMSENGRKVSFDRASREVVAEAMADILPDSKFIDRLAENHKPVFDKLLFKLKDFASNLKAYFGRIYQNSSPKARMMKRQLGETLRYADRIIEKFDAAAVSAVENYQRTVAVNKAAEAESKPYHKNDSNEKTLDKGDRQPAMQPDNSGIDTSGSGESLSEDAREVKTDTRFAGSNGKVPDHDSEGRSLDKLIIKSLSGTAITDDSGKPLPVYHYTPEKGFTRFEKGNIGFHFGSVTQALQRMADIKKDNGRMFRVYLNIKNPLRIDKDYMNWHANSLAMNLWNDGILTDDEFNEIVTLSRNGVDYDSAASKRLREMLVSRGWDGIVYNNEYEANGDSFIAFYDKQIIAREISYVNGFISKREQNSNDFEDNGNERKMD